MAGKVSIKRAMITKANATMVSVVAAASFVVVFCLVASFILIGQLGYQNKVISKKKAALAQLKTDISSVSSLVSSYNAFVEANQTQNVIGGDPSGSGDRDGDNAQIVLDALPSKYDFPAMATSIEKMAKDSKVTIENISGTDDELSQSASKDSSAPVPMPFTVTISGSYSNIKKMISSLERSIRPFQISQLHFTGGESDMTLEITGQTYYQPAKTLNIKTEVVQ
ncbi:type 4a pilus biogenesis protein PilO [Candidatus Saccharibacteria bacterium]|nr:type 4a pilus biogenesis protein PilO [Candidatus Saccharibacteria bacterium]